MSWQQGSGQSPAPGWYPDPSRRFEQRYWDGSRWTEHVVRQGQRSVDPPADQRANQRAGQARPEERPAQPERQLGRQPERQPEPQRAAVPGWGAGQASQGQAAARAPAQAPAQPQQAQQAGWPGAQPAGVAAAASPGGQLQYGAYPPGYQPARRLSARNLVTGRYAIPGRVGPSVEAIAARAERPPIGKSLVQTGAVFAFIIVLALGGFAVARITGLPKEAPVQVGTAVRITPPSGWEVKESEEGAVWLSRGSANLRVVTGPAPDTSPEDLAKVALDALREDARGPLLVSDPESLTAGGGHPASRVAYQGQFGSEGRVTIVQGEVTAVVAASGTGVVFDAWSLPEIYPYEEGDVHKMIEEAEIR